MQSISKYSVQTFTASRTWLLAAAFIAGNIALPQLCHLATLGGPTWLPIYFFTLVGAYAFGWRVGVLTAVASPVLNMVLFGMPVAAVLPAILIKSVLLAVIASYAARKAGCVSLLAILVTIIGYQTLGFLGELAVTGSLGIAMTDFRLGLPGMAVQLFGGYLILRAIGYLSDSKR